MKRLVSQPIAKRFNMKRLVPFGWLVRGRATSFTIRVGSRSRRGRVRRNKMEAAGGTTYFVSRHHEHPPATLEELLRASAKRDAKMEAFDLVRARADDAESDSDYQYEEGEDSADDFVDSEPEVDERRLHATEPREGLYLHEMRRQRGRMEEKEAQWVRGYIKAQRTWKARTGRSIDEFHIPGSAVRRMKKSRSFKKNLPRKTSKSATREQEDDDANASLLMGTSRLETLLLLAAIVFVCLSLGVQLYASFTTM
jgi:hypothetical protein